MSSGATATFHGNHLDAEHQDSRFGSRTIRVRLPKERLRFSVPTSVIDFLDLLTGNGKPITVCCDYLMRQSCAHRDNATHMAGCAHINAVKLNQVSETIIAECGSLGAAHNTSNTVRVMKYLFEMFPPAARLARIPKPHSGVRPVGAPRREVVLRPTSTKPLLPMLQAAVAQRAWTHLVIKGPCVIDGRHVQLIAQLTLVGLVITNCDVAGELFELTKVTHIETFELTQCSVRAPQFNSNTLAVTYKIFHFVSRMPNLKSLALGRNTFQNCWMAAEQLICELGFYWPLRRLRLGTLTSSMLEGLSSAQTRFLEELDLSLAVDGDEAVNNNEYLSWFIANCAEQLATFTALKCLKVCKSTAIVLEQQYGLTMVSPTAEIAAVPDLFAHRQSRTDNCKNPFIVDEKVDAPPALAAEQNHKDPLVPGSPTASFVSGRHGLTPDSTIELHHLASSSSAGGYQTYEELLLWADSWKLPGLEDDEEDGGVEPRTNQLLMAAA